MYKRQPVMIVLALFTFGLSCIVLHFGVFVDDLYNVMNVVLRLMFYMSGIFYSIGTKLSEPYRSILLKCNPVSMLIESARRCMLYSSQMCIRDSSCRRNQRKRRRSCSSYLRGF